MKEELTKARKWLIIVITSLSAFMATLDGSIVNIALPVLSRELHVSIDTVQWIVTAYLLTISIMLLIWGKLSDLYGKRLIFSGGFLVFALGSGLCSFAQSLTFIVIARILQALGASAMMGLSQAIVTGTFPPTERGRALGVLGTMVALGSLVGPSLGGILVHAFGWPSIFLINIPIGVIGFICALTLIPEIFEKQKDKTFDIGGTALFVFSMLVLFLALLFAQEGKLPLIWLVPAVVISLTVLWLFIRTERRSRNPLLDVGLFRVHEFSTGLAAAYLTFIGMNATTLFIPFYLQSLLGFDAMKAGLIISAYPIAMAVFSPLSGWLSDRISYRPLTVTGMTLATTGFVLLATINETTSIPKIVALMALLGMGGAIFMSPNTSSVMGCVPRAQLGIAGGTNALFRNLGMVSGTTFSVLIFSVVSHININELGSGFNASAFLKGLSVIFLFSAACTFASLVISLTRAVRFRKPAGAQ